MQTTTSKTIHCPQIGAAVTVFRVYEVVTGIGGDQVRELVAEACSRERTCGKLDRCPLRERD